MKTLRYLLIVIAMAGFLNVQAQGLAQQPQAQMQSTSVMQGAGSTLPQAAVTGTMVTGTTPGTYTPANTPSGRRKVGSGGGGGGSSEGGPDDREDPYKDPLGDVLWPMMLAAAVYGVWCMVYKRRKRRV